MAEKQATALASECPICWSPFDNAFRTPKLLRCRHTFCIECLAHLSLVASDPHCLQCPLCRHPTELPSHQAVTALPTNGAVLRLLRLEPNHVVLDGRRLYLKDQRKSRYFLRQPRVYTLDLGSESSDTEGAQTATPSLPDHRTLRECSRNPQLRLFSYLMAVILIVIMLLVFFIFWTNHFFTRSG
uniref:Ring finger protein 183 n=1 Tax=Anolis carolinensis TaxID=28377 RepID=A0A803SX84_ANOCA|nr:PREDICTED: RING finger protein 183 [Anolis carolinensis]|eukprot:XP_003229773.1 PREDICTED: RING finger protein 183 [Anolis carolinensis]